MDENRVIHRLYLHVIVILAADIAPLTLEERKLVRKFFSERCEPQGHVTLLSSACHEEHAHLIVRFSPEITIDDMVNDLKSYSAAMLQKVRGVEPFAWDESIAVMTFSPEDRETIKAYLAMEREGS